MHTKIVTLCRRPRFFYKAMLLLLLFSSASFSQDSNSVALVLYPEIRAPYNKVFSDIVDGFSASFDGNTERLALPKEDGAAIVSKAITSSHPQVVLALGRRSHELYQSLSHEAPVLLGASSQIAENIAGISMIPDAAVVLKHLLNLSPDVQKVYVVRRTGRLDATLNKAKAYLAERNIELDVRECDSLREGAAAYRNVLGDAADGDAVWILPGSTLIDNAVLSMMLGTAWQKDLILFSSNPLHVKRGLLFAVYPDNYGMGKSLAGLANKTLIEGEQMGMTPLTDVLIAVNERTSRHVGIELTNDMKNDIDLLLPAR